MGRMMSSATGTTKLLSREPRLREGTFFNGMAIAVALTVFAGFARTYYLRAWTGAPPVPSALVHVHAVVFTAWIFLLFVQIALVEKGHRDLHRRLGVAGGGLALMMIALGYFGPIASARRGFMGQFPNEPTGFVDPLAFLILGLGDILLFGIFIVAALYFRSQGQIHKRLMMLATISLLPAALARIPLGRGRVPFAAAALVGFLAAGPIYDWKTRGRIHAANLWGGVLILISVPLRPLIGNSGMWHKFAQWLVQ
jgi:hypothetical protein